MARYVPLDGGIRRAANQPGKTTVRRWRAASTGARPASCAHLGPSADRRRHERAG